MQHDGFVATSGANRDAQASLGQILLIYAVGVAGMLVVSIAIAALGGVAAEFHPASAALVGWVMSIPAVAAVLGSLLIGALVDRIGDRPVMLAGAALVAASDCGVIAAGSFPLLLLARVIGGLGYVGMVVAAVAMIGRSTQGARRTLALALWSTVIPASFVVATLVAIAGRAGNFAWRVPFAAHGLLALVVIAAAATILPRTGAGGGVGGAVPGNRLTGLRRVVRAAGPWQLGASFCGAAFLQTGLVAVLPALLAARLGVSQTVVQAFALPGMICNVVGAFGFGALRARGLGADRAGIAATLVVLVGAIGLCLSPGSLTAALMLDCLVMIGLGVLVGMWALLPAVVPDPSCYGAASGMITQITLLGVLLGPPLAFALSGSDGRMITFILVGAGLALFGLPVWRGQGSS